MQEHQRQHGQEDVIDCANVADLKQLSEQRLPCHKLVSLAPEGSEGRPKVHTGHPIYIMQNGAYVRENLAQSEISPELM